MKQQVTHKIVDLNMLKQQLLAFSELFNTCSIYDSNGIIAPMGHGRFELLAGFGIIEALEGNFADIGSTIDNNKDWLFASLSYESYLKFDNFSPLSKEDVFFYKPMLVCYVVHGSDILTIINNGIASELFNELLQTLLTIGPFSKNDKTPLHFKPATAKETYISNIEKIKENILEGDYYEINYCQKFESQLPLKDAISTFNAINKRSPTPFAAFIKNDQFNVMCTSPERFIYRSGNTLICQPIKGTNKRLEGEDNRAQLNALKTSEKEIAENVMIVDLVRNDMSKICHSGSVVVEELFGTYPFALVNQMISTVKGQMKDDIAFVEIFKALFPMGSMTGAPKIEVMKNIAIYEDAKRGWYSGCAGYIMPDGNFDFNVVIRTLVEDKANGGVSYHVGGAITYDSIPESEFEECLLKARGLINY